MVLLDVKRSEKKNEFMYETTVKAIGAWRDRVPFQSGVFVSNGLLVPDSSRQWTVGRTKRARK